MRALAILCAAVLGAACTPSDDLVGRGLPPDTPLAAPGHVPGAADEVDPMIVGDRLLAADQPELAIDAYLRAAARDGMTQGIRLSIASANIELGRLGQAEALLRDVLEEDPQNAGAMNNLGVVLLEQGEWGEAHRVLRAAFALQPTPEIRDNLLVSETKLASRTYADAHNENAFTLTERGNGVVTLSAP
ncbi:tetratricopeptide repeat protein [Jannaschia formosa]|uniref:tetratricopeptide repeat protein n=1 Tax=Jannaschia formosa TaxID=2259592 RepID=UPI000E1BFD4A|nr:tetratricopeptide repeat protein [Jannaschia formosa]TFL19012.1 tetratricopeptide repeat protein [Jannaschia formosa]